MLTDRVYVAVREAMMWKAQAEATRELAGPDFWLTSHDEEMAQRAATRAVEVLKEESSED